MIKIVLALLIVLPIHAQDFVAFFASGPGNFLKTGLLAFWPMDEASGSALDASGNGLTLTENAPVAADTGLVAGSRLFTSDDSTDYFTRASDASLGFGSGTFTISLWANVQHHVGSIGADNDYTFVSRGSWIDGNLSWWLVHDSASPNDTLHFFYSVDGSFDLTRDVQFPFVGNISDGWYFIVVRGDGTNIHLSMTYITDSAVAADAVATFSGPFFNTATPLYVGSVPGEAQHQMNGDIDNLGIWSRYLDDCQVTKLFSAKAGAFAYPQFDFRLCAP